MGSCWCQLTGQASGWQRAAGGWASGAPVVLQYWRGGAGLGVATQEGSVSPLAAFSAQQASRLSGPREAQSEPMGGSGEGATGEGEGVAPQLGSLAAPLKVQHSVLPAAGGEEKSGGGCLGFASLFAALGA